MEYAGPITMAVTGTQLFKDKSPPGTWWPLLLGLVVLYVPTYYGLSQTIWAGSDSAHGPIVLAIILWLFWQHWREFVVAPDQLIISNHSRRVVAE